MKEPPKGAVARATAVAEGVATAMRRRQRDREPRVLLYREPGDPHLLAPGAKGHDRILENAEKMIVLLDEADAEARAQSTRRARREARAEARAEEKAAAGMETQAAPDTDAQEGA